MVRIKICGITRLTDGIRSAELGADAIGFVFYEKSPRNVSFSVAAEIAKNLPKHTSRVGVFVTPEPSFVDRAIETVGLDIIQVHGIFNPETLFQYREYPLIAAVPVKDESAAQMVAEFQPSIIATLLDTYHHTLHGGTGAIFDWKFAAKIAKNHQIILAGGLTPENVAEAANTVQPYAVDISSGVESAPGKKDHHKLDTFFKNLREYRREWKPERDRLFPFA